MFVALHPNSNLAREHAECCQILLLEELSSQARTESGPACAGGNTPVRLSGAKSRMGHSEPVAGLVGLANMAAMLGNQRAHAIMHLRQVR